MLFIWIIFLHWIADFICQTHWQAINKSTSIKALSRHVISYSIVMVLGLIIMRRIKYPSHDNYGIGTILFTFALVTFVSHFLTDYCSSRVTSYLYKKGEMHDFFVVIGFDQFIHYVTLFWTLHFLGYGVT